MAIQDGLAAVAEAEAGSLDVLVIDAGSGDASQVGATADRSLAALEVTTSPAVPAW